MKKFIFFTKAFFLCLFLCLTFLLPSSVSMRIGTASVAYASEISDDTSKAKLNVSSKSIVKEDSYTLKTYNLTDSQKVYFKSDNTDIVSVTIAENERDADIMGLSVGKATITATVKEGFKTVRTMSCTIVVTPPAKTIKFTNASLTLKVGDTVNLKDELDLKPLNTAEVPAFYIEDSESAVLTSVTATTFKACTPGQSIVMAEIANGTTDSCVITVLEPEEPARIMRTKK